MSQRQMILHIACIFLHSRLLQLIHWEIPLEIQEAALVRAVVRASVTTCDASVGVRPTF